MKAIDFFQYLAEASLILAVLYGWFQFRLAQQRKFGLNRAYLVGGLLLALTAPAIHIPVAVPFGAFALGEGYPLSFGEAWSPVQQVGPLFSRGPEPEPDLNGWFLLLCGYGLGLVVSLLHRILQFRSLRVLLRQASPYSDARTFRVPAQSSFSFANKVFLGRDYDRLNPEEQRMLLAHEQAHIRQYHRLDLMVYQVTGLLLWFHPLLYRWGAALRQQHEYLADRAALQAIPQPRMYARLLLSLSQSPVNPFAHHFAFFPLKRRITMLFSKPKPTARLSYLLSIPVLALCLCSFSPESGPALRTALPLPVKVHGNIPTLKPVDNHITSGFGMRLHPITKQRKLHMGVDIRAALGTPVMAAGDGTVTDVKDSGKKGYGKHIIIDHGEGYVTRYAQLSEMLVTAGQVVRQGEVIGKVGSSGMSTAPHLHYEIRLNGKAVDPVPYFEAE